jgi:hypothetical protein
MEQEDRYFAAVSEDFALGGRQPGLALGEEEGQVEVLVAPDGRTARLAQAEVRLGLPESAALAMMDAVEEAIEDARAASAGGETIARLEQTLALLERSFDDEFFGL